MRSGRVVVAIVAALLFASPAMAQIYKCEVHGQIAFQDSPCPGDAKTTVIGKPPPPSQGTVPELMPASLEPAMPPPLDTSGFRPPAQMSLQEIYNQMQVLGAHERALRAGMQAQMQSVRAGYQASLRHLDTRHGVMSDWGKHTTQSAAKARARVNEDVRLHRQYDEAVRAIVHRPMPEDPNARAQAMRERQEAMAQLNREWDARLSESRRAVQDASRAMQAENRAYQQRMKDVDSQRDANALKADYAQQASRVNARWSPRLRVVEARQKVLNDEIRRRCPGGASLSSERQMCRQAEPQH